MTKKEIANLIGQAKRQQAIYARNHQFVLADQMKNKIKLLKKKLKE